MLGKPMILIPISDHTEQSGNAKKASKLGLAEITFSESSLPNAYWMRRRGCWTPHLRAYED
jgi:UDP-N-acetylglucosamine:LPS N-acetylglucosamine transferase